MMAISFQSYSRVNEDSVVTDSETFSGFVTVSLEYAIFYADAQANIIYDTENYVAASRATGIKRNRKRVLIVRSEIIAVTLLREVVDE